MEPVKNLIQLQPMIQRSFVAMERLNDIMDLDEELAPGAGSHLPQVQTWSADHILFRYGNHLPVLEDVSISIHKGEKVALVGFSGSGKSSLARLFLRFYEPERGTVAADGVPVRDYDLGELRNAIAYVNQDLFVFADTIENNIRFGNKEASAEEIQRACNEAGLDEFIADLPLGLQTLLDEGGASISRGQLQRIVIARALLRRPQLLILDEATSSLDPITALEIEKRLFHIPELTCLIISHRLEMIRSCNRIYVLENGQIAEEGTHDALISEGGSYSRFWNAQHGV